MTCPRQFNQTYFYMPMIHALFYSNKSASVVEERLNIDFNSLCDWFEDNKLSIHLGVDKTKSILFSKRRKKENIHINRRDTTIIEYYYIIIIFYVLFQFKTGPQWN